MFKYQFKHKENMNKLESQTIKPTKKMQNPFMKYKDVTAVKTDGSVDSNYSNFSNTFKEKMEYQMLGKCGIGMSLLGVPCAVANLYMESPTKMAISISGMLLAGAITTYHGFNTAIDRTEVLNKEKVYMNEYSEEQKTYLFKKMYNEFEKHLENGKKLVNNLIGAGFSTASSIGIAVVSTLTEYNSMRIFATGLAIGSITYALKIISEHIGEKKAIKEIEKMM